MQHVGTDLAAPRALLLVPDHGGQLVLTLLQRQLVELAPQHVHRHLAVHVLGPLVLAADHDPRRNMGDADGGVRPVDVLPARAAGPEGIHPQVLGAHLHVHVVGELRRHPHRREAGVPPMRGVERRDAHQAVHALLRLQKAVGVVALHHHRGALDPRLLVGRGLQHRGLQSLALRVAQIHPEQHLRPVLGVQPSGPGVHRQDSVGRIVVLVQQDQELVALQRPAQLLRAPLELPLELGVVALPQHLLQDLQVIQLGRDLLPLRETPVDRRELLQDVLVPLAGPEVRGRGRPLQLIRPFSQRRQVKGCPAAPASGPAVPPIPIRSRRSYPFLQYSL